MTNRSPYSSTPNAASNSQQSSDTDSHPDQHGAEAAAQSEGHAGESYQGEVQEPGYAANPQASYSSSPQGTLPQQSDSSALIQVMRELNEVKQIAATQVHHAAEDVNRLRGQMRWLTGISAVAIVLLGGALIGVTLGLRQEQTALRENQQQMNEQIETLQAQRGNPEQLNRIEELLMSINENAQNLGNQTQDILENLPEASGEQIRQIQEDLQELQQGVRENLSQEGALERLNNLYERVRGLGRSGEDAGAEGSGNAEEGNTSE